MMYNILNPDLEQSLEFLNKYYKLKPKKNLILIIGDCIIKYNGRAKSFLDWGQRIIMINSLPRGKRVVARINLMIILIGRKSSEWYLDGVR